MVRRTGDDGVRSIREPVALRRAQWRAVVVGTWLVVLAVVWSWVWAPPRFGSTGHVGSVNAIYHETPLGLISDLESRELSPWQRESKRKSLGVVVVVYEHKQGMDPSIPLLLRFPVPLAVAVKYQVNAVIEYPDGTRSAKLTDSNYPFAAAHMARFREDAYRSVTSSVNEVINLDQAGIRERLHSTTNGGKRDFDGYVAYWPGVRYLAFLAAPLALATLVTPWLIWRGSRVLRRSVRWTTGQCPECGYPKSSDRYGVCSECGVRVVEMSERGA